ncbi:MAG: YebC/PmpR family DNA-binding transcriptional regulator, partial [Sandaracinus sp.]|nr:YebC/PmpR family DNA-binding transcriptional regulator [Sandaracinus sp.]
GREIAVAVRQGGENPETNPALRRAIQNARAVNMPKEKIETAIKRALGKDAADYQELIYEGYAPHGIAVMVVAATDNPTRTIANVRVCFNKGHGSLGTPGSVSFSFTRMGVFRLDADALKKSGVDLEELELELIDHGLEDMGETTGEKGEAQVVIRCPLADFGRLQEALEEKNLTPVSTASEFIPQNVTELSEEQATEVLKLIDLLEQDDDVQQVFHNLG